MEYPPEIQRLRELAGIRLETDELPVLLPASDVDEMRKLLEKLKAIAGDESQWHVIYVDGFPYMATGVVRDL